MFVWYLIQVFKYLESGFGALNSRHNIIDVYIYIYHCKYYVLTPSLHYTKIHTHILIMFTYTILLNHNIIHIIPTYIQGRALPIQQV